MKRISGLHADAVQDIKGSQHFSLPLSDDLEHTSCLAVVRGCQSGLQYKDSKFILGFGECSFIGAGWVFF